MTLIEEYVYEKEVFIQQFVLKRVGAINSFNITDKDLCKMIDDAKMVFERIDDVCEEERITREEEAECPTQKEKRK